jgi:hypothetical protein
VCVTPDTPCAAASIDHRLKCHASFATTTLTQEDGNIEDDAAHGPEPFEVSGGNTMIQYLQSTMNRSQKSGK